MLEYEVLILDGIDGGIENQPAGQHTVYTYSTYCKLPKPSTGVNLFKLEMVGELKEQQLTVSELS